MKNKRSSFTLVETVVAMAIMCGILLIPAINYHRQIAIQKEKIFLTEFRNNWNQQLKYSLLNNNTSIVYFDVSQKKQFIRFVRYPHMKENDQYLPDTLKIINDKKVITIHQDGSVSPQTIAFKSRLNSKVYKFKVQMEWGQLIYEKT